MIVVVGGGPAGMSAALAAAEANAKVMLIDSAHRLGGQYWRNSHENELDSSGAQKYQAVMSHPNIEVLFGATIWRADYKDTETCLQVLVFGKSREIRANKVILCTGAYDRTLAFPGWDIPGVMTPGAAQSLLKGSGVIAGKKIVIAGTGPFLMPVAAGLAKAGATIVGLFEANRSQRWLRFAGVIARNIPKLFQALTYKRDLKKHGVAFRHGYAVIEALPNEKGLLGAVRVAKVDSEFHVISGPQFTLECDVVAVGWGFTTDLSLAGNLGLAVERDHDGSLAVKVNSEQETSVKGIYAAGEITGIGGAELAQTEGTIAGLVAAGTEVPKHLHKAKAKQKRFATAIAGAYPVGKNWVEWLQPSTIICRCEEVSCGDIESAISDLGATDSRSAKLLTRAGMGMCQGRICGRNLETLVATQTGYVGTAVSSMKFANRPIVAPITLEELADTKED